MDFGFCRGIQLSNEASLRYGDNKEIRQVKVTQLTGPLVQSLHQLVQEALPVNEEQKKKKQEMGSGKI